MYLLITVQIAEVITAPESQGNLCSYIEIAVIAVYSVYVCVWFCDFIYHTFVCLPFKQTPAMFLRTTSTVET